MAIKSIEVGGTFRYLWLKSAGDVDLSRHCARCPAGDHDGRISNRPGEAHGTELDGDAHCLRGASQPYRRENNFHLASRRKDGSATDCSSNGATARTGGAERLPTDARYNNPAGRHHGTKPYRTCRNRQFANYFETHMKRGIENG